jgi:hypothetical protein
VDGERIDRPVSQFSNAPRYAEPPAAAFGARGEAFLSGTAGFSVSSAEYDGSQASHFSFVVSPGADYFFVSNVSLGLGAGASYSDLQAYAADSALIRSKVTAFSVGPRIGFNIPITEGLSWYSRFSVGYESVRRKTSLLKTNQNPADGAHTPVTPRESGAWMSVYAPLLWHFVPRFFVGFGPSARYELTNAKAPDGSANNRATLGADVIVGGHWGGAPRALHRTAEPSRKPLPLPRFGRMGQLALTSAFNLFVSHSIQGNDQSYTAYGATPEADYFIDDHIAFSLGVHVIRAHWHGSEPLTSIPWTNDVTDAGGAAGFAAEVPISDRFSLYPRAALGFGHVTYDRTYESAEGPRSVRQEASSTSVFGSLPVLFHVAPHFFAGLGPAADHDLTRRLSPGDRQNRATRIGASSVVGGWF